MEVCTISNDSRCIEIGMKKKAMVTVEMGGLCDKKMGGIGWRQGRMNEKDKPNTSFDVTTLNMS